MGTTALVPNTQWGDPSLKSTPALTSGNRRRTNPAHMILTGGIEQTVALSLTSCLRALDVARVFLLLFFNGESDVPVMMRILDNYCRLRSLRIY